MAPDPPSPPNRGLRAKYVRNVTADHVGERVSVRHLIADPQGGSQPTDVVGRLLVHDEDVLLIVTRAGQLHVIADANVVSSRVVPPHPRLEPEPMVGTQDDPLMRQAARVLLLDPDDRALLIAHVPAPDRQVWTAPGGGLDPGEDHRTAALRELDEELGIAIDLGPWVWTRRVTFSFRSLWIDQDERWFLARTDRFDPAAAPLDDHGAEVARWFSIDELRGGAFELAPALLADHLASLLRDGPPDPPVDVGR